MAQLKCAESFEKIFSYTRRACQIIGLDIIQKYCKVSWRTAVALAVAVCGTLDIRLLSLTKVECQRRNANRHLEKMDWRRRIIYIRFITMIRDTFFWVIFVQIGTEFFGIACTVVCIFLSIWPSAPVVAIYLFAMIYSFCFLGNLVESANDEVTDMIYDCSWYSLTTTEQKLILIMLTESQHATGLSIGGVAPLSLNTALQLTKTIYTFAMMLKESVE